MWALARAVVLVLLISGAPAVAAGGSAAAEGRTKMLQVSEGVFNVSKTKTQSEFGVELRVPTRWWRFDVAGGVATTDQRSFWGYGGLRFDWDLSRRFVISPGFAIALYEAGDGKNLGGLIEFRSSIELGYRLTKKTRLGLLVCHLSNAGFYDLNPGANSAVVAFSGALK